MDATAVETGSAAEVVRGLWCETLQGADIVAEKNFFELGGDSLQLMIMLFRVNETFGLEITPDVVFDNPTLGQFSQHVSRVLSERENSREGTL